MKPKPTRRFPPIPKRLRCPGGDVPVAVVPHDVIQKLADPGEHLMGYFHEAERKIALNATLSREAQWRTLYHEWIHAVLQDSGLSHGLGDGQLEEALCDSISAALMVLLYPKVTDR